MRILLAFVVALLEFSAGAASAFDFSPYADSGPTLSGEINYFLQRDTSDFDRWRTEPADLYRFWRGAWVMSTRSSSTQGRSYIFALTIDLYNSLPPDALPEPEPCPPKSECDVYEPALAPLKAQAKGRMLDYLGADQVTQEKRWQWARSSEAREIAYLVAYVDRRIDIDPPDAPASLDPRQLDLRNPTHYAELKRWMAETVTARERGVPPWEVVAWNAEHCAEWNGCDKLSFTPEATMAVAVTTTPTPATTPGPASRSAEPPKPRTSPDKDTQPDAQARNDDSEAKSTPWGVIALTVLVAVAVLAALRRRKSGGSS